MPDAGSRILTSASWAVAGGLAAWAAARITAADRVRRIEAPLAPLLSFTPQATAAGSAAALALALAGQRGPAATAALSAAVLARTLRPRAAGRPQPAASGPVLRVLTVNLLCGRADADTVVALVRQADADVLFVQELTSDAVTRLKQAGLGDLLPQEVTDLRGGPRGSGIYSRFPVREGSPLALVHAAQPCAVLEMPGGRAVEVICVHPHPPKPPSPRGVARWRRELAVLPPPGKLPRVVAGDFNATLDHAVFRSVLRLGYADAALEAGKALTPTWGPAGKVALITIDHVLVDRRCAVLASSVHAVPGSDHRAVHAAVRLPGR